MPSQAWMRANLIRIGVPFRMTYDRRPIERITIHRKCAASLTRVLNAIWIASGHNQAVIDAWGVSIFGGTFNFRLMRGINQLSMHAYGCAIDLDPARNGLGDQTPHFDKCPQVVNAFVQEGWEWGGHWPTRKDGMHFQAARTR